MFDDSDRTPTEEDRLIEQRNWKDLVIPKDTVIFKAVTMYRK